MAIWRRSPRHRGAGRCAGRTICAGWANSFGQAAETPTDYGQYDIEILAEINHAPRLSLAAILRQAAGLAAAGADLIDFGCDPGDAWPGVGPTCAPPASTPGYRVSIDSMNPDEIEAAVRAGAELVLSVNSGNRHAAADWGCEVVVVPDVPATLAGLDETVEQLAAAKVPLADRSDPGADRLRFCRQPGPLPGRAAALSRRRDADGHRQSDRTDRRRFGRDQRAAAGLLPGAGIRSVLTTQVINWARTSVRECDLARRLVYYAVRHRLPPKRLDAGLVMLRDAVGAAVRRRRIWRSWPAKFATRTTALFAEGDKFMP